MPMLNFPLLSQEEIEPVQPLSPLSGSNDSTRHYEPQSAVFPNLNW